MGGYYAMMDLSRQAGSVQGKLAVAALSPGYEVNDMGFQAETGPVHHRFRRVLQPTAPPETSSGTGVSGEAPTSSGIRAAT